MTLIQILPLTTMSVAMYVGLFHAYMYIRKIGNRTNLSFSWVCLYMVCFSWLCLMNYNTRDLSAHMIWVRLVYITLPIFSVTMIHFVYDFTRQPSHRVPWILTGAGLLTMAMMVVLFMTSSGETPVYIHTGMADFSYVAFRGNGLTEAAKIFLYVFTYGINLYGMALIFTHYRRGNSAAGPILAGALLFLVCGVNDTLIETGVYSFVYLSEYGGLFLILGMAVAVVNQMSQAQQEMSRDKVLSAIGKMATEVVHDLTTPLDAIKLAASIARENGNGSETRDQYLSLIEQETRRLSDLSFDILQCVNTDGTLAKQTVDLKAYMQEVCFLLQGDFKSHGIGFDYNLDYDGPVSLDPDAFKRLIINLASNAREILIQQGPGNTNPGFSIHVGKRARDFVFAFSDNGPGIPDHMKDHIFEPFATYGKPYGTGLGLAISKQIADRHGGTISWEPGNGNGTTIRVSLPL